MVEGEHSGSTDLVEKFFESIGTGFEARNAAKQGVFDVLIEADKLMDEGSNIKAKELLSSAKGKAEELHSLGQLDRRYLTAANIVVKLIDRSESAERTNTRNAFIRTITRYVAEYESDRDAGRPNPHDILTGINMLSNLAIELKLFTDEEVTELTKTKSWFTFG